MVRISKGEPINAVGSPYRFWIRLVVPNDQRSRIGPRPGLPRKEVVNFNFLPLFEANAERMGLINYESGTWLQWWFIYMTEDEMANTVFCFFDGLRDWVSESIVCRGPFWFDAFCGDVENILYLVARGNLILDDDGNPVFMKPAYGPPSRQNQQRVVARIRADRAMHLRIFEQVTGINPLVAVADDHEI